MNAIEQIFDFIEASRAYDAAHPLHAIMNEGMAEQTILCIPCWVAPGERDSAPIRATNAPCAQCGA